MVVTGMHRSGTSLLAQLLEGLGADFGPQNERIAPGPDNPRGFVEMRRLVLLNDEILERSGGSWDEPPELPGEPNLRRPEWKRLRRDARFLIRGVFGWRGRGWVKDPRLALTLPFWRYAIRVDGVVALVREPVAVADSLRLRDGMATDHALALYVHHLLQLLRHASDATWIVQEQLVADPASALRPLQDLNRDLRSGPPPSDVIVPSLDHASSAPPLPPSELAGLARALYEHVPRDAMAVRCSLEAQAIPWPHFRQIRSGGDLVRRITIALQRER